jgi:hypothetical protein
VRVQVSVTWFVLHLFVQDPQWLGDVRSASQPSLARPLQSAWVASHVTTEQTPLLQCSTAPPLVLHAKVQPPQWVASVLRLISHPSAALWLQSAKPVVHPPGGIAHAYPVLVLLQTSVALAVLHTCPQAPQLLVVVMGVSHPLATLPSQSAKPALQVILHTDPTQVPTPPLWLHTLPQAPQLFGSLVTLISQPFAVIKSQSLKPAAHPMIAHFEALHVSVALAPAHAVVQFPQWFGSLVVLTSHPLAAGLQWARPGAQFVTTQTPFVQTSAAVVMTHGWPQEPQLLVSPFAVSISQPLEASMSQFA